MFIGKDDEKAMEDNLRKQGLEFEKMELYAKMDDEKDQFGAQKGRDQFKNRPAMKARGNIKGVPVTVATESATTEPKDDWGILRQLLFTPPSNLANIYAKIRYEHVCQR